MAIQLQKKYRFRIDVKKTILNYVGVVTDIDEHFITFTDINGKVLNYNINSIISYEELEEQHAN